MSLEIGKKAPAFTAETDADEKISLNDYKDRWLVLYFYPKDNTSGCTKEACEFRDNMEKISALGIDVVGVSPDSVKSHVNFKEKNGLNFTLLSDPDKSLCEKYGVWVEKKMYGRSYMGVQRATFIIGPDGKIKYIWEKVKVAGHVDEVIEKLIELKAN